jgi:hypothetical protein
VIPVVGSTCHPFIVTFVASLADMAPILGIYLAHKEREWGRKKGESGGRRRKGRGNMERD